MCRIDNRGYSPRYGGLETSITNQIIDGNYEVDDFLLVDAAGEVQAVSGNSEFTDILPSGWIRRPCVVVQVVEINGTVGGSNE